MSGRLWSADEKDLMEKCLLECGDVGNALGHFTALTGLPLNRNQLQGVMAARGKNAAQLAQEGRSRLGYVLRAPDPRVEYVPFQAPARITIPHVAEARAFITDIHRPYHDRAAWELAKAILREGQPDVVILGGDIGEYESVSKHAKSRPDTARLSEENLDLNRALDELQSCACSARWYFLQGNHESRVTRFLNEEALLAGAVDFNLPVALYMEAGEYERGSGNLRGMTWVPLRDQPFTLGPVAYLHGVYESTAHAQAHANNLMPTLPVMYGVGGHMHAFQSATSAAGRHFQSVGWLGDPARHVFAAYTKGKPRPWQQGMLWQEVDGDLVTDTPIHFRGGRALFGGKSHEAQA